MSNPIHYLNGHWRPGHGAAFSSLNPSTAETLWSGQSADAHDVDLAFRAARAAFEDWSERSFDQRAAIAQTFAELLKTNAEAMARTIAREVGKPVWEARTEVAAMAGKIALSIAAYQERTGTREQPQDFGRHILRHKPHGVVAVYGPYNFPGHLPNGHIVPALLAGNCVVFKPSELTPLVAQETVKLWEQAGLPPGALNLVQGERSTGEAVAKHPELDGLYFTGSSRTGAILNQQFAARPGVILALEMGGNNPLIVGSDIDIDAAVYEIVQSAWISSGQRCTCARRLFVPQGEQGNLLLARLADAGRNLVVGRAEDEPQPFMGPLISAKAADGLKAAHDKLIALGGTALLPMQKLPLGDAFVSPGLVDITAIVSEVIDEEDFGPLLKVIRYATLDEAIAHANATRYGLSAGLLSNDDAEWQRFFKKSRAGIVNRNKPTTGASGSYPFGGVGDSGNHRASAYYAADYCSYPVSSTEAHRLAKPTTLSPGLKL